jgi:hypothetical protein
MMATRVDERQGGRRATASPRFALAAVGIAAAMLALIAGAWLALRAADSDEGPAPESVGTDTLQWVVGGVPQPLPSVAPLLGDLSASIALAPGDERYARTVDVFLFHENAPGDAVDGAVVQATATMLLMDHGAVATEATPTGDGHYLLPLRFGMPGEWQIDLAVSAGDQHASMVLVVEVWS